MGSASTASGAFLSTLLGGVLVLCHLAGECVLAECVPAECVLAECVLARGGMHELALCVLGNPPTACASASESGCVFRSVSLSPGGTVVRSPRREPWGLGRFSDPKPRQGRQIGRLTHRLYRPAGAWRLLGVDPHGLAPVATNLRPAGADPVPHNAQMTSQQARVIPTGLSVPAIAAAEETLRSDSRAPYVHRLTLYDEDGTALDPTDDLSGPYSPRATCGKCHAYATISSGWHFNAGLSERERFAVEGEPRASARAVHQPDSRRAIARGQAGGGEVGRPGEPWILADARTGTQVPISIRGWPGTYRPKQLELSNWDFALRFGRHLPGGGLVEPDSPTIAQSTQAARWRISGTLQIDCMICHSADGRHDPAEAERQIEKENFKWIPTAALTLGVVRGEARKAPDDWDPLMPGDPDYPELAGPKLVYDASRFDPDDRVFFSTADVPSNERCYFCHTVREVGASSPQPWATDRDVHLTAGLTCVDCHGHGLDHAMIRGYEGEATHSTGVGESGSTCRGCHLGDEDAQTEAPGAGGRYGAPHPLHRGLPTLHFDKLTCTACHAGPWPGQTPRRLQTSRAHGLGVASKERTAETPPEILGPVFARQEGKIGPQRMIWPAAWGRLTGDTFKPFPLAVVEQVVIEALPARATAETISAPALTLTEIGQVLAALSHRDPQAHEPVYLRNGLLHRTTAKGAVATCEHPAAAAYVWPIAHDVRPASQAFGINGCTDCHAADAPFCFGRIAPETARQEDRPPLERMYELQGRSPALLRVWASAFAFRLTFKVIGFGCLGIIGVVLFVYGFAGATALLRQFR